MTCKQKVKHVCSINALTNLSSWTGRNGEINSYWSGDKDSTEKENGIHTITSLKNCKSLECSASKFVKKSL